MGVLGQNDIWVLAPWLGTKNIIRGKVVVSLKSKLWWVLFVCVYCSSFVHLKCCSYALTNLLFSLCKSMWIIDLFVICLSPHLGALACPSTPKVLWIKERAPTLCPFVVFTFRFAIDSIQELVGVSMTHCWNWNFVMFRGLELETLAKLWV